MKERPILFSGAMVRAILEGRKTQTRRVVKIRGEQPPSWATFAAAGHSLTSSGSPKPCGLFYWSEEEPDEGPLKMLRRWPILPPSHPMAGDNYWTPCPYGRVGDHLWVRETWQHSNHPFGPYESDCAVFYRADYLDDPLGPDLERSADGIRRQWRPSIHMPRGAGRLTLEITGVRIECLNDCSEDDARAEGSDAIGITFRRDVDSKPHLIESLGGPYRDGFRILWESINGAGAWEANPWVWVMEFRRIEQ
ncbi:hypothetical protein [Burkholderia anthina]|uniref:hypothetical protein n=1 Tax=Burkholderia anthina TaxID=179879 RepID=UPI00158C150C|nr:hypothetical protein [Burkholderia anthina]